MAIQPSPELERKFSKAKSLLILDSPFFGAAVAKRPVKWLDSIPTAAMSATGQMVINPTFAEPLTVKQIQFLLAHEAMHYMLSHSFRRKHRDPKAWNIACDKVINDTLVDAKVGDFIDGCVTFDGARNNAAEELYDEQEGEGGSGPGGTGMDIGDPTDENGKPLDDATRHTLEAQAKIELVQAAKAAKARGKLPVGMERMIDEIVNVPTPWHEILANIMTRQVKDGISWKNPNRRFIANGLYLPGNDYVPKMGEVVIGVDTSGSIGDSELAVFEGHINRILESCGPEKVHVVYCDAEVNHVDSYELDDMPIKCTPHGGGGTAFQPVFDWVSEQGIAPEAVIYLTDGYGDQHRLTAPPYPVVWLTTDNTDFDFGTVVPFKE